MVGTLQRVALGKVWAHEARDFTPWLEQHIEVLNDALNMRLSEPRREQSAGTFSVDLVAEDETGNRVVIENQFGKSDHDHLGKLITYLTAFEAKTGIWIVAEPRPEHVSAVAWLNESQAADFYLVKVEAVRIGNSAAAALFTVIVGPSEEARQVGETKTELAERQLIRRHFWEELLDKARSQTEVHTSISPGYQNWVGASAGKSGLRYSYVIRQRDANVELYIDTGEESQNKAIYDDLISRKDAIEGVFGGALEWYRLDGKQACRIEKTISLGGYRDQEKWSDIQDEMIDAMVRLHAAMAPHIAKLS
ncbi:MAG: DUF4268 domain-containing protein [Acidobacteria bacterium]|nr:DUF4268 domain-containing protein [Acidobacteriota bacterium]